MLLAQRAMAAGLKVKEINHQYYLGKQRIMAFFVILEQLISY